MQPRNLPLSSRRLYTVAMNTVLGYIEGYYGRLLSSSQCLAMTRRLGELGASYYLCAPKNEPMLRREWRKEWDPATQKSLREWNASAAEVNVRIVPGLSPGLDIDYAREAELVADKLANLVGMGCSEVALLLDDIALTLPEGQPFDSLADAHAQLVQHALKRLQATEGFVRLWLCPTVYADNWRAKGENGYVESLAKQLPDEVVVLWTGTDIVAPDLNQITSAFSANPLFLWDNYYANDYCPWRLFLGERKGAPEQAQGWLLNPTGLAHTDALLLSRLTSRNQAMQSLQEAGVPMDAFAEVAAFFDGPFDRPEPPSNITACREAARHLAFSWEGELQLEWYPYMLMLDRDLAISEQHTNADWLYKYYPPLVAQHLYNS